MSYTSMWSCCPSLLCLVTRRFIVNFTKLMSMIILPSSRLSPHLCELFTSLTYPLWDWDPIPLFALHRFITLINLVIFPTRSTVSIDEYLLMTMTISICEIGIAAPVTSSPFHSAYSQAHSTYFIYLTAFKLG